MSVYNLSFMILIWVINNKRRMIEHNFETRVYECGIADWSIQLWLKRCHHIV